MSEKVQIQGVAVDDQPVVAARLYQLFTDTVERIVIVPAKQTIRVEGVDVGRVRNHFGQYAVATIGNFQFEPDVVEFFTRN